jgi:hypothetical protein
VSTNAFTDEMSARSYTTSRDLTLQPLYLSVDGARAGEQVCVCWRATSTSAESWVDGAFDLPVAPEALDVSPEPGKAAEDE